MSSHDFPLTHKTVNVGNSSFIAANEDIFNGDPATDVVNLDNFHRITFIIAKNAGATGTATITVESCDDVTPTTATAVAFKYRVNTTADTWGEWTDATASGFATTAGADQAYEITITASDLNGDDKYVRLKATEVADSPCDGAIIAILTEPRYAEDVNPTVLT